jgi:signal transduction histidine kinase
MTGDAGPGGRPIEVLSREDVLGVSGGTAILIVDDSTTNLVAYEAALAPLGRQLVLATSGDEALAKLLEQDFALILLDVSMPGLSGIETARLIRGRPRSSGTPLIFISGQAWTDEVVVDAYRLGALDFVTKPILPEVLRAKARLYLQLQERTLALLHRTSDLIEANQVHAVDAGEADRKDELIALLGHELRNPLAVMSSALDVIALREGALGRELVIVQRQIRHLARMVDDLVDVSRIRHGTIAIRPARVLAAPAVADAIETVRFLLDTKSHTIEVDVGPDVSVAADPDRLVQALAKAIDNAARYTSKGGRIRVSATRDASFIRLTVEDNGQGISRDLLPRIFEPFVQEPRPLDRSTGGLGLGLTLVRTLVELHGGYVTADSPGAGLGTTLAMYWPQAHAAVP